MPTLHLGVIDIPYAADTKAGRKGKKKKAAARSITTGEVADILEGKYHVMELFFEENRDFIVDAITKSLSGNLVNIAAGAPPGNDAFGEATQAINEKFKQFVIGQDVEHIGIPGTPTAAAVKGVSHRKAHPYASGNPRRPSFVDTGLYVDNFMSWID